MKMKTKKTFAMVAMGMIILFAVAGCSDTLSRSFYTHHPRSIEDVESVWGQPVAITAINGGMERRTYPSQSPVTDLKYRYFLIKNGMVLASGITDTEKTMSPETHQDTVEFIAGDLSKAFYARHRTTVDHLDRTWGKPLIVKDDSDRTQYRVYEIDNAYTDFRFRKFVVRDGIVVASRLSPESGFKVDSTRHETRGIEINEISHRYYKTHPMSLEAVESTWGEPVSIEKTETGLEKRTYRLTVPSTAAFEFRFFIIDQGMVVSSGISDTMDDAAY
jgi:hypothetical protein